MPDVPSGKKDMSNFIIYSFSVSEQLLFRPSKVIILIYQTSTERNIFDYFCRMAEKDKRVRPDMINFDLKEPHKSMLAFIMNLTGEKRSETFRRLIREEAEKRGYKAADSQKGQ